MEGLWLSLRGYMHERECSTPQNGLERKVLRLRLLALSLCLCLPACLNCVCVSPLSWYVVPRAPVSAEAHVIGQPPGKTVVRVTWEPSKKGIPPDWYDVDLTGIVIFLPALTVPGVSDMATICCSAFVHNVE